MSELFLAFKGRKFSVSTFDNDLYFSTFPDVQIWQEYLLIDLWLERNPNRRGTRRFVTNWLTKEQRKFMATKSEARIGTGPSAGGRIRKDKLRCADCRELEKDCKCEVSKPTPARLPKWEPLP